MPLNQTSEQSVPVIVYGEVLFDTFPEGRRVLGGAPFNVAWSLNGFGRSPLFISAVGQDDDGKEVKGRMRAWEMENRALQTDPDHATGAVHVSIKDDEPSYEICRDRAWDYILDEGFACSQMLYHGLLALRNKVSRDTLHGIVERSTAQRFFDINLRPPFVDPDVLKDWIRNVDWLKLNIDELRSILDSPEVSFEDCDHQIDQLRETFSIQNVVLTGGSKGAIMRGSYGNAACSPAPRAGTIVDTVGAGDSFSGATIEGILRRLPPEDIVATASGFAARVCGLRGATTDDVNFYRNIYHA